MSDWHRLEASRSTLLAELVSDLRGAGLAVGSAEAIAAYRALLLLDLSDPVQVTDGIRACLTRSPEDRELFDRIVGARPLECRLEGPEEVEAPAPTVATGGEANGEGETRFGAWSAEHRLRTLDFAEMSDEERRRAARLVEEIGRNPPMRASRRYRRSKRAGRLDLRRTLQRSWRFDREPVELRRRRRKTTRVPINLILDVSGSMRPYAAMLLHYLRASVVAQRASEAFVFGTEARRVTVSLRSAAGEEPLSGFAEEPAGWGGGTRIGAALGEINRDLACYFGRGGIAVIASDGWDRGDPEQLEREMRVLRRRSRAVIWLSPHSEQPGFEPLVSGLSAALPYVDLLLSAQSVEALGRLSSALAGLGRSRVAGPARIVNRRGAQRYARGQ